MEIYIIIEILLLFFSLKYKNYFTREKVYFYMFCVIILSIFCLRSKYVGTDTSNYVDFFHNIGGYYGTWSSPTFNGKTEFGFILFCKFVRYMSDNDQFFLVVYALVVLIPLFYYIDKYANHKLFTLSSLFVMHISYMMLLAAFRQSLAMSFLLLAYIYYKNNFKYKQYIIPIFIIFAFVCHNTSIIMVLLVIIVYYIPMRKKYAYICILISLIIGFSFGKAIGTFMELGLSTLADQGIDSALNYNSDTLIDQNFVQLMPFSLMCCFSFYYMDNDEINSLTSKMLLMACVFSNLFNNSGGLIRFILIFQLLGYVMLFPKKIKTNKEVYYIYVAFMLYFTWRAIVHQANEDLTIPGTRFFWFWQY
jgi:hypothetical protein